MRPTSLPARGTLRRCAWALTALLLPATWLVTSDLSSAADRLPAVAPAVAGSRFLSVPLEDLVPAARGNTVYRSEPLSARVVSTDAPVTSITFQLRDLALGSSRFLNARYLAGTTASTEPVTLTSGHRYSLRVTVTDADGRTAFADQGTRPGDGFLAVSLTARPVVASFAALGGRLTRTGSVSYATFSPRLTVASDTLEMSGTQHAGFGYAEAVVPLGGARLCGLSGSQWRCASLAQLDRLHPAVAVGLRFGTTLSRSAQPVLMGLESVGGAGVGTLRIPVPSSWTRATLQLPAVKVNPVLPTCAGGTAALVGCGPDPLRFFVPDNAANAMHAARARQAGSTLSVPQVETTLYYLLSKVHGGAAVCYTTICVTPTLPTFVPFEPVGLTPNSPPPVIALANLSAQSVYYPLLQTIYTAECAHLCWSTDVQATGATENVNGWTVIIYIYNSQYRWSDWPNPGNPHEEFDNGGYDYTCAQQNGAPNCNAVASRGFEDADGSPDGDAVTWAGSWGYDYYSATANYSTLNGSCQWTANWSYNGTYSSNWGQFNPVFQPNTLSWQLPNLLNNGAPNGSCSGQLMVLWGFSVGANLWEGHYNNDEATVQGAYVHAVQTVNWQWSFACGTDGCGVGVSPSTSEHDTLIQAGPINYDY